MGEAIHPLVRRAGEGILPAWARAGDSRRKHMARVADLLADWAEALGLDREEGLRWRALGFLHDALRDAAAAELRSLLTGDAGGWTVDWGAFALGEDGVREGSGPPASAPDGSLHGPAAAQRLNEDGVEDRETFAAVAYHTVGHPDLGAAGRALYCADHLDPGRPSDDEGRARLRARYPEDPGAVLRAVLRDRMRYLLERDRRIFLGTVRMWNRSVRPNRLDGARRRNPSNR